MSSPNTAPQENGNLGEKFLGFLAAIIIVITAILEGSLMVPRIGKFGTGTIDVVSLNGQCVFLVIAWLGLLAHEFIYRHEEYWRKKTRKWAWGIQIFTLALCAGVNWESGPWAPLVALFLVIMTMIIWDAYLKVLALHPEDQQILDRIIEQDRQHKRERWEHEQRRQRASRLAKAAALYGNDLQINPDDLDNPMPSDLSWKIPARKHPPLVYFIRNGNRVKIGTTTGLRRRISDLALRQENVLLLKPGGRNLEKELHQRFARLRDGNTEWFRLNGELREYVMVQITEALKEGERNSLDRLNDK
ncbi:GIY-YIG nuclease family protein [Streptomyces sp. P01-B04]|uniref:GIY-YIG nuclease family protein n=1 Tax=Streptomyces poriferorum TaxID=2798799 RepID=UPI001C5FF586|nr:GIY-YIG nuclease family protein [Streptomyces poriferorum]MBW5248411.1 GIY-YIG nuclease family protein [Streptomyces poriferorum]MBW5256078.1 GIY-YIG nuclease family protein [Streptomyces poriferorum]